MPAAFGRADAGLCIVVVHTVSWVPTDANLARHNIAVLIPLKLVLLLACKFGCLNQHYTLCCLRICPSFYSYVFVIFKRAHVSFAAAGYLHFTERAGLTSVLLSDGTYY
jgi:hypothetical protein